MIVSTSLLLCLGMLWEKSRGKKCARILCLETHFFICYIFQEHVNEIDFDYMEYARQRFQQYWLRKPALLGSVGASPGSID